LPEVLQEMTGTKGDVFILIALKKVDNLQKSNFYVLTYKEQDGDRKIYVAFDFVVLNQEVFFINITFKGT